MTEMTDKELEAAIRNRAEGEASLACEGMYLSPEQKQMFDQFEAEGLSHEERRKRIMARYAEAGKLVPSA